MTPHHRPAGTVAALLFVLLVTGCRESVRVDPLTLYDLQSRQTISDSQAIDRLRGTPLILVGEHHTDPAHHAAQLHVIRSLDEAGVPLSIGLEMFRKDQQTALDQWIAGEIDENAFETVYLDNWNFPWRLYREIFIHARKKKIPMVGLNVSREVTRQVARHGFASLSDDQREELENVTCNVTPEYREFIRSALGAHGHGDMEFTHFCEAQLVWDTTMAINAINALKRYPGRTMVLLAGSGHARKMGIPYQVGSRSRIPFAVLLPMTPGIFDPDTLTPAEADFLVLP